MTIPQRSCTETCATNELSPYAVLGVPETATPNQLRRAFKARLLEVHPDKPNGRRQALEAVQNAYRKLTASISVPAPQAPAVVAETVTLNEMDIEDNTARYPCRCGDIFMVPLNQVLSPSLLVLCQGCSLAIRVVTRVSR